MFLGHSSQFWCSAMGLPCDQQSQQDSELPRHLNLLREFVWFETDSSSFDLPHNKSFVNSSGWSLPSLKGVWFDDIRQHKDKIFNTLDSSKEKLTENQKKELKQILQSKMTMI